MNKLVIMAGLVISMLAIGSCKKDDKNISKINVYLTDAPALYSALNIEILSVTYLTEKSKQEKEFDIVIPGVYDLFKYSNGVDTMIANTEIPTQRLKEIRIVLGENNSIAYNGKNTSINVTQSFIVIYVDKELEEDKTYNIWLDIDVSKSIKQLEGSLYFTPVFRYFEKENTGNIRGIVLPTDARCFVSAYNDTNTFGTIANEHGIFMIQGIPPGKYNLRFVPQREELLEGIVEDIEVKEDSSSYIGTVALN